MATGQGSPLTPEPARSLTPVAKNSVEPLRGYGAYAQALDAAPGADDAAGLLCYLGRPPKLELASVMLQQKAFAR